MGGFIIYFAALCASAGIAGILHPVFDKKPENKKKSSRKKVVSATGSDYEVFELHSVHGNVLVMVEKKR